MSRNITHTLTTPAYKMDFSVDYFSIPHQNQINWNTKKEVLSMAKTNKLLVPGAEQALEQFKYEIAQEFGVNLGSNTASRSNGSVGGEVTKRLVSLAQQQLRG